MVRSPFSSRANSQLNSVPLLQKEGNLQGVVEQLVHLGNPGRDAEVDCPVADLDDEATNDIGVDLAGLAPGCGESRGRVSVQCS